jgi:hypothetical protein
LYKKSLTAKKKTSPIAAYWQGAQIQYPCGVPEYVELIKNAA